MISLEKQSTLLDIEDAKALTAQPNHEVLRVPSALRFGGNIGIVGSLIQLFASWSRTSEGATLKLYGSAEEDSARSLAQEPHGMAALYFASHIVSATDEAVSRREALAHSVTRIQAMQASRYLETMHGRGAFLACFAGAKNEYLLPFYERGTADSLRSRDDYITMTTQMLTACAPKIEREFNAQQLNSIGALCYELFRNTHEHARTDERGLNYEKNIRGVLAKFVSIKLKDDGTETLLNSEDPSQSFFFLHNLANLRRHEDDAGRPRTSTQMNFVELTVFDTGPGLARRWLSRYGEPNSLSSFPIEEEVEFVRECFRQHSTTKDVRGSGAGLERVVKALRELRGFLQLRTGRVCLVQDFSSGKAESFSPKHWLKDRTELPMTSGATYSIIVPLSRSLA